MCSAFQSNTYCHGLLYSQWHKEKSHLLSEILTIQFSGELSRNKGFLCGNSRNISGKILQEAEEAHGSTGMRLSRLQRAARMAVQAGDARGQRSAGRCPGAKPALEASAEVCFLLWFPLAGAGCPGRAEQAPLVYVSAALRAGTGRGSLSPPRHAAAQGPALHLRRLSASPCPGLPHSGESTSVSVWPVLPAVNLWILTKYLQENISNIIIKSIQWFSSSVHLYFDAIVAAFVSYGRIMPFTCWFCRRTMKTAQQVSRIYSDF